MNTTIKLTPSAKRGVATTNSHSDYKPTKCGECFIPTCHPYNQLNYKGGKQNANTK